MTRRAWVRVESVDSMQLIADTTARARSMQRITEFDELFDMRRVCTYFEQALHEAPYVLPNANEIADVTLSDFIHGYRELNKYAHFLALVLYELALKDVPATWHAVRIRTHGCRR